MTEVQIILTSIALSVAGWILIFKLVLLPRIVATPIHRALLILSLPHVFRFVGLSFLIPGVTHEPLDPRFAVPAAYGDLLSAVLAMVAVVLLARESRWAKPCIRSA